MCRSCSRMLSKLMITLSALSCTWRDLGKHWRLQPAFPNITLCLPNTSVKPHLNNTVLLMLNAYILKSWSNIFILHVPYKIYNTRTNYKEYKGLFLCFHILYMNYDAKDTDIFRETFSFSFSLLRQSHVGLCVHWKYFWDPFTGFTFLSFKLEKTHQETVFITCSWS